MTWLILFAVVFTFGFVIGWVGRAMIAWRDQEAMEQWNRTVAKMRGEKNA